MKKKGMRKKVTVFTYIKRILLVVVVLFVVIFLSVYFLDTYKAQAMNFENEYPDEYWDWDEESLNNNGFVSLENIYDEAIKADLTNPEYQPPYDDYTDFVDCLNNARYDAELEKAYNDTIILPEYQQDYEDKDLFESTYQARKQELAGYTFEDFRNDNFSRKKIAENDRFILEMNLLDSTFKIHEKDQEGNIINTFESNPTDSDVQNKHKAAMIVKFVSENISKRENYEWDTFSKSSNDSPQEGIRASYYVKVIEDESGDLAKARVQIYYIMQNKGLNASYFPTQLTRERVDELFERCNQYVDDYRYEHDGMYPVDSAGRKIEGLAYGAGMNDFSQAARDFYYAAFDSFYEKPNDISPYFRLKTDGQVVKWLYPFFYEWCQYTEEDLLLDNGSVPTTEGPIIGLAIEYSLTDDGLEVVVPGNSIRTNTNENGDNYQVTEINVLPYFTSSREFSNEGYFVIPDGSGAILNFDNGKSYDAYQKRIYSGDLTFINTILTTSSSDILLPMYGMVKKDVATGKSTAMIAEVTKGEPQVRMLVDVPKTNDRYNYANYTIVLRETQVSVVGTNQFNRNETNVYTDVSATYDYHFNYHYLSDEYETSYSGIAKCYRDILIDRSEGKLNAENDQTAKVVLDLEVIGSYSYKANFLGIGYTAEDSLTTVDQLKEMLDELLQYDVSGINVYYKGWRKEGLVNTSFKNIKVSSEIGGKKKLLKLINEYNNKVNIYPYLEFLEYNDFQESFGKAHYTARDITGLAASKYPYDLQSNVFNTDLDEIMILSPAYYDAFSKTLAKKYQKTLGIDKLALSGLGSKLSGNYKKKATLFKTAAIEEQIKSFENLRAQGITNIALDKPYAYAIEYSSNLYDLPYQSTLYEILDYTIPFYQLVINGLVDYSGESINQYAEKGLQEHLMKCIETGSNPAFTFTYDDSSELLQTNYNNYYYTLYTRWLEDVKTVCDTLNELDIFSCNLVSHERLANDVFKVTYENLDGSKQIEIILNYQKTNWVSNEGIMVPAKSYTVI